MHYVRCPLCSGDQAAPVFDEAPSNSSGYVRCGVCGLAYLNPQPEPNELEVHYSADYLPFQQVLDRQGRARRLLVHYGLWQRARLIDRYKHGGELLEIGCADGTFLHYLESRGNWRVQGLEVSDVAVRAARERYGLKLIHESVEAAVLPDAHYDVVAMWDVLEHLPNPRVALAAIHRIMKPDGVLIIRMPLEDGWDARLFGRYWAGWSAPYHLAVYSADRLERLLAGAGFSLVQARGMQSALSCLIPSIRQWAEASVGRMAKHIVLALAGSALLQALFAPLSWLIGAVWPVSCRLVVACPVTRLDSGE